MDKFDCLNGTVIDHKNNIKKDVRNNVKKDEEPPISNTFLDAFIGLDNPTSLSHISDYYYDFTKQMLKCEDMDIDDLIKAEEEKGDIYNKSDRTYIEYLKMIKQKLEQEEGLK